MHLGNLNQVLRRKDGPVCFFFYTFAASIQENAINNSAIWAGGTINWCNVIGDVPAGNIIWKMFGNFYREEKVNHFLWRLLQRVTATQHFIGCRSKIRDEQGRIIMSFSGADSRWWCTPCELSAHEDVLHLVLHCWWCTRCELSAHEDFSSLSTELPCFSHFMDMGSMHLFG